MGKKKRRTKVKVPCVYCGEKLAEERDHVIPRTFFEKKPSNMVTVPVCRECNLAKSKDEPYLRDLCSADLVGHRHPEAQAVFHGPVSRAIEGNRSDFARIARTLQSWEEIRTPEGRSLGVAMSVPVDPERIGRLLGLMMRGLLYHLTEQRIPQDYVIEANRIDPLKVRDSVTTFVRLPYRGPYSWGNDVFECLFAQSPDDPALTMWLLRFYRGAMFVVSAVPEDLSAL